MILTAVFRLAARLNKGQRERVGARQHAGGHSSGCTGSPALPGSRASLCRRGSVAETGERGGGQGMGL